VRGCDVEELCGKVAGLCVECRVCAGVYRYRDRHARVCKVHDLGLSLGLQRSWIVAV
jgi:hypothetical protein